MKDQIILHLERRLSKEIASQNPLSYLKDFEVSDYIDEAIASVFLYTRTKDKQTANYFVEVISAVGHRIRKTLKQKLDSALAAKTGAFVLYTFEELGIIEVILGQSRKKHAAYIVRVTDEGAMSNLWKNVSLLKTEKLPSEEPYADWTSFKHETGIPIVKTTNKSVLRSITPETHPMVYETLNKSQRVGWRINKEILKVQEWALRNKALAFNDIWSQQNSEAKATKMREATTIMDIAERFLDKTFYHLYNLDFRSRKYCSTAYLNEQGSDTARGLLLRDDSKPIGEAGFRWLMISLASNWAGESGREDGLKTDKIPLEDRYLWSLDNEEILISYAESPKVNQGWMTAEKPWQFLAACNELQKLRRWQEENKNFGNYGYRSHLEIFIDGSNNGSQHLAALTRDETTAPHVNLVPSDLPGDLYRYVGEHVWSRLNEKLKDYSESEIEDCERFIDTMIDLKKELARSEKKSAHHDKFLDKLKTLRNTNPELLMISAPVYWARIKDLKEIRKVVKR
jgi:hypothetical protein